MRTNKLKTNVKTMKNFLLIRNALSQTIPEHTSYENGYASFELIEEPESPASEFYHHIVARGQMTKCFRPTKCNIMQKACFLENIRSCLLVLINFIIIILSEQRARPIQMTWGAPAGEYVCICCYHHFKYIYVYVYKHYIHLHFYRYYHYYCYYYNLKHYDYCWYFVLTNVFVRELIHRWWTACNCSMQMRWHILPPPSVSAVPDRPEKLAK